MKEEKCSCISLLCCLQHLLCLVVQIFRAVPARCGSRNWIVRLCSFSCVIASGREKSWIKDECWYQPPVIGDVLSKIYVGQGKEEFI